MLMLPAKVSISVSKGRESRDKPGRDVPGQKKILIPVSLCPGTRAGANVPRQNLLSQTVPGQNEWKIFKEKWPCFRTKFSCFKTSFPVIEYRFLFYTTHASLCPTHFRQSCNVMSTIGYVLWKRKMKWKTSIFFC